jgi:preprotein translocase subunit YajC
VESLASLLPLVGIALLFWLLLIRPAQRRQREMVRMQSSVDVGDEVVLTSGVYGTIASVGDDRLGVRVADGVVIHVARGAIGNIITTPELSAPVERSDSVEPDDTETTEER